MLHARKDYDRIQDPAGKIADDEPVFIVRAKDRCFLPTLLAWCEAAENASVEPEMIEAVKAHAALGVIWASQNGGAKVPDAPAGAFRQFDDDGRYID